MTKDESTDECASQAELDLEQWAQGDILSLSEYFHVTGLLSDQPSESDVASVDPVMLDVLRSNVHAVMITTQTCDIVRSHEFRPYFEVSPIEISSDQDLIGRARSHKTIQHAHVPWYNASAIADLDRTMTIEKTALGMLAKVSRPPSKDELKKLQATIARRYSRFAFPNEFVEALDKFRQKLASKHAKQTPEGELLRSVSQIRVMADPGWDAVEYEVTFYFIVSRDVLPALPDSVETSSKLIECISWFEEMNPDSLEIARRLEVVSDAQARGYLWGQLVARWMSLVDTSGSLTSALAEVTPEDEFTMREYWTTEALDLDYLSDPKSN